MKKENLKQESLRCIEELTRIYTLDPQILKFCQENDRPLFTTAIPFLEMPLIDDINGYIKSMRIRADIERDTGGLIYYGFSVGDIVVMLFVDGNSENWSRDFPAEAKNIRAAIANVKKKRFVIQEVALKSFAGILTMIPV